MPGLLRQAADLLDRVGLGEPAFRLYQRLQAVGARSASVDPKLPPAYLRVLTAGSADAEVFVQQGRAAAAEFMALAKAHTAPIGPETRVLEFGCGSGRVARWVIDGTQARFTGCDINPKLIAWCQANLAGDFRLTELAPPLPYADAAFDLVYALSVFTHMHEANARAWFAELARVTAPGGLALLTFLDDRLPTAGAVKGLAEAGFGVRREGAEGGNLLSAYFTDAGFAQRAGAHWRLEAVVGSDASAQGQAVAVLRREAASPAD
ncbi:class I SAM-dependent methyltransferase [Phenylobacterium immobile]|uniref:class I SAM-dependent methyltransferase n=1 Tax=Phenylobacterium immobile TaxID=21 RepID=UPI000ADEAD9F|nr:class I SAM-dependent methyltransferase [Phenylobacterium immobile]